MVLEEIIRQEDLFISEKKIPNSVEMNYSAYCTLIQEVLANRYFSQIHGMNILITDTNKITVR